MSWAKLSDDFHSHPTIRAALGRDPAAVALYVIGLSFAGNYETDGALPEWFAQSVFPNEERRRDALATLIDLGLWSPNDQGYTIRNYLAYNASRAELEHGREARRRAGREGGKASGRTRRRKAAKP